MSAKPQATATLDAGVEPHAPGDLLIGFSFSVWPDGSPGRCNEQIAKSLRADLIRVSPGAAPRVGLQWEVFDALEDLNTHGLTAAQFVSERLVVGPPRFEASDIRDAGAVGRLLRDGRLPAVRRLAVCLMADLEVEPPQAPSDLAAALNRLLDDRRLFDRFDGLVDLIDLDRSQERPELSCLGTEKRRIPTRGLYPHGLRRFQARRVNRQLIEAIVPQTMLTRAPYLGTRDVAGHVLDALDVSAIRSVWVYAHPDHRRVCRQHTIDALRARAWSGSVDRVQFAGTAEWDPARVWDADSAQVWCRSQENWEFYQSL